MPTTLGGRQTGGRRGFGPPEGYYPPGVPHILGGTDGFRGTPGNTGTQLSAPVNGLLVDQPYAGHRASGIYPSLPQYTPPEVGIEPPWILYGPDPRLWPKGELERIRHTPWELERVRQWWRHRYRHRHNVHQPIFPPRFTGGH